MPIHGEDEESPGLAGRERIRGVNEGAVFSSHQRVDPPGFPGMTVVLYVRVFKGLESAFFIKLD